MVVIFLRIDLLRRLRHRLLHVLLRRGAHHVIPALMIW
jgi:hypothetical protein